VKIIEKYNLLYCITVLTNRVDYVVVAVVRIENRRAEELCKHRLLGEPCDESSRRNELIAA
jgi:hypothetical protein